VARLLFRNNYGYDRRHAVLSCSDKCTVEVALVEGGTPPEGGWRVPSLNAQQGDVLLIFTVLLIM
jgi:hypothetical protein